MKGVGRVCYLLDTTNSVRRFGVHVGRKYSRLQKTSCPLQPAEALVCNYMYSPIDGKQLQLTCSSPASQLNQEPAVSGRTLTACAPSRITLLTPGGKVKANIGTAPGLARQCAGIRVGRGLRSICLSASRQPPAATSELSSPLDRGRDATATLVSFKFIARANLAFWAPAGRRAAGSMAIVG